MRAYMVLAAMLLSTPASAISPIECNELGTVCTPVLVNPSAKIIQVGPVIHSSVTDLDRERWLVRCEPRLRLRDHREVWAYNYPDCEDGPR